MPEYSTSRTRSLSMPARSRRWLLLAATVAAMAAGCSTVPVTGRKSFNLIPDSQANSLGADAYKQVQANSKLIKSGRDYDQVLRVGKRIAAVADEPTFQWAFALIDEPKTVNAFCLPGGKVAVYSGILPVTRDDDGLAVVLAHEIGHAIARHGSERMTDDLALQLGGAGLQQLIQQKSPAAQQVVMAAFGVGTAVGSSATVPRGSSSPAIPEARRPLSRLKMERPSCRSTTTTSSGLNWSRSAGDCVDTITCVRSDGRLDQARQQVDREGMQPQLRLVDHDRSRRTRAGATRSPDR